MSELIQKIDILMNGVSMGRVESVREIRDEVASLEAQLKERDTKLNDIHEAVAELIGGADDVAGYDICVGRVDYEMLVDMFPLPSPPAITEKDNG